MYGSSPAALSASPFPEPRELLPPGGAPHSERAPSGAGSPAPRDSRESRRQTEKQKKKQRQNAFGSAAVFYAQEFFAGARPGSPGLPRSASRPFRAQTVPAGSVFGFRGASLSMYHTPSTRTYSVPFRSSAVSGLFPTDPAGEKKTGYIEKEKRSPDGKPDKRTAALSC